MESSSETISDGILKSKNGLVVVEIRVREYLLVYVVMSPKYEVRGSVNNSFGYGAFNFFLRSFFALFATSIRVTQKYSGAFTACLTGRKELFKYKFTKIPI